jgi:hypothetical protein
MIRGKSFLTDRSVMFDSKNRDTEGRKEESPLLYTIFNIFTYLEFDLLPSCAPFLPGKKP